jgi:16S rRNA (cytosine1402-N4)-methyltransferase
VSPSIPLSTFIEKNMLHIPVLLHEVIKGLSFEDGDVLLDCTLGSGGHILGAFETGKKIQAIGIDLDEEALTRSEDRLKKYGKDVTLVNESFRNLDKVLDDAEVSCVNKVLFDLGVSSHQIDESGRGFTIKLDEPLVMTLSKNPDEDSITAYDVVNDWDEENLADVIYGYGEEPFSRKIAKAIVEAREIKPIETTGELVEIITNALPSWVRIKKGHPATKTFQAIRIAVNDELGALKEGLAKAFDRTCSGGRIGVITFHSLEDRIVKRFFREKEDTGFGENLFKKPLPPSDKEIKENPRSRSSKLRIFIKK